MITPLPALRELAGHGMHRRLGADVDALGGLVEDQHARARAPATSRSRPSAGCRRTGRRRSVAGPCALIAQRVYPMVRQLRSRARGCTSRAARACARFGKRDIRGDRERQDRALLLAILRHAAPCRRAARRPGAEVYASRDPARSGRTALARARCGPRRPGRRCRGSRHGAPRTKRPRTRRARPQILDAQQFLARRRFRAWGTAARPSVRPSAGSAARASVSRDAALRPPTRRRETRRSDPRARRSLRTCG